MNDYPKSRHAAKMLAEFARKAKEAKSRNEHVHCTDIEANDLAVCAVGFTALIKRIIFLEITMGLEANILSSYKAKLATIGAADAAKDAQITALTAQVATLSAGGKDAADVASEAQAITDLGLNPDGTTPAPAAPTPAPAPVPVP